MITNIEAIGQNELVTQLAYLAATPVSWLAVSLSMGLGVLKRGIIQSHAYLGQQRTIFSDLGGVLSTTEYGIDKFLVRHVPDVLLLDNCADVAARLALQGIRAALAAQVLNPRITILRTTGDMIVDGNKTAAAYYDLHAQGAADAIALPVYIAMCDCDQ